MTYDTDVLVVGSGPTGMTTALALATYGVNVHVVSMWNWLANTPRAHITNQRAAEVLRDLGVSEEVKKYAVPWELMGDTLFTTSLAGEEVARLPLAEQAYRDALEARDVAQKNAADNSQELQLEHTRCEQLSSSQSLHLA